MEVARFTTDHSNEVHYSYKSTSGQTFDSAVWCGISVHSFLKQSFAGSGCKLNLEYEVKPKDRALYLQNVAITAVRTRKINKLAA
jgi:hypothetical protein